MFSWGKSRAIALVRHAAAPAQGWRSAFPRLLLWAAPFLAPCPALFGATITLAWNPVPDPQVVAYKLHYGTLSRNYDHVLSAGSSSTTAVSGLSAGTTYFFAVTSCTSSGLESAYSTEISYTVPSPSSPTTAPSTSPTPIVASPAVAPAPLAGAGSGSLQYHGLFYESDQVRQGRSGAFVLATTQMGRYSGYLLMGRTRLSFHGQFDAQGQATVGLSSSASGPLTLQLRLTGPAPAGQLQGSVSAEGWSAPLSAERAASNPAPFQGTFTLLVPGQDQLDPTLPAGHSFGLARINAAGSVRLAASLADGTKLSLGSWLSAQGRWPLYAPLYSGQGCWLCWLSFTNRPTDDFNGPLSWIKPANLTAPYYPAGFTNQCQALGSAYSPYYLAPGPNVSSSDATMSFAGPGLEADFANLLTITPSGQLLNLTSNRLTMSFTPASGLFHGVVNEPTTGKPLPFFGAMFEKSRNGYGLLFNGEQSSHVLFKP